MPAIQTWYYYQPDVQKLVKNKVWEYWLQVCNIKLVHVRSFSDTVCISSSAYNCVVTLGIKHVAISWFDLGVNACVSLLHSNFQTP
jgi:hypothetical protein